MRVSSMTGHMSPVGSMYPVTVLCVLAVGLVGATIVSWLCHDGLRQDWLTVDARAVQCGWLSVDARAVRPYRWG